MPSYLCHLLRHDSTGWEKSLPVHLLHCRYQFVSTLSKEESIQAVNYTDALYDKNYVDNFGKQRAFIMLKVRRLTENTVIYSFNQGT